MLGAMPIYEYRCECGALLEAIEKVGEQRALCGELCTRTPPTGDGRLERVLSGGALRGTGNEAKAPTVDVHKRAGRKWDDCA
jgi:predicted nucleic acid-binding Zn ribbon protein